MINHENKGWVLQFCYNGGGKEPWWTDWSTATVKRVWTMGRYQKGDLAAYRKARRKKWLRCVRCVVVSDE